MSDVCFYSSNTQTHTALNVLQFWQNVQGEAVGLPSRPITSVHVVAKSQHQAEHLQYTLGTLQRLVRTHTHTHTHTHPHKHPHTQMGWRCEGWTEWQKRKLNEKKAGDSPCTPSEGFLLCGGSRWCIRGKSTETGCRTLVQRSWGFGITGIETWRGHKISHHDTSVEGHSTHVLNSIQKVAAGSTLTAQACRAAWHPPYLWMIWCAS